MQVFGIAGLVLFGLLLYCQQFMKNSLSQTVVLHQIGLWQQEHSKQLPSQKWSQPQCLFLYIKHL